MAKGRKPISNEVKRLRGTDQPCRTVSETSLDKVAAVPRSGLKGSAKKVFELVATELIHKNILELVGLDLLVAYAREMTLYHDLMKDVDKEGLIIEVITKKGVMTVVNPKRKIAESALANAKSLSAEFGLTPATRGRIAQLLSPEQPKDAFAEFEEIKDE